jgi:hypothetical protein
MCYHQGFSFFSFTTSSDVLIVRISPFIGGVGVFAIKDVPSEGTLLLTDQAVIESNDNATTPNATLRSRKQSIWGLTENTLRLTESNLVERLLSPDPLVELPYACGVGTGFWEPEDTAMLTRLSQQYDAGKDAILELYDLFATNAIPARTFAVGSDVVTVYSYGFFRQIARFNHSCHPNATLRYRPHLPSLSSGDALQHSRTFVEVVALRPISRAEEITISYVSDCPPTYARQELWSRFHIRCRCPACRPLCGELTCTKLYEDDCCSACSIGYCSAACRTLDYKRRHVVEHRHPMALTNLPHMY